MVFDWIGFLKRKSIHFIREGKNVKQGCVNIRCPLCGVADPSQHMGINPTTGYWACWRNTSHRGRSPQRLLIAITGCTWDQAETLAAQDTQVAEVGLDALLQTLTTMSGKAAKSDIRFQIIDPDPDFQIIRPNTWQGRFWDYLHDDRGFYPIDVQTVIDQYQLKCCTSGRFRQRIIFPFLYESRLVGWTGRAIGYSTLRYLSHPTGNVVKNFVYNHDAALAGGPTLAIVEGPFDTLKVDYYGRNLGVTAVGVLGVSMVPKQLSLLANLAKRFDKVVSILDEDALSQSLNLAQSLAREVVVAQLPEDIHDPGEMEGEEVRDFLVTPIFA